MESVAETLTPQEQRISRIPEGKGGPHSQGRKKIMAKLNRQRNSQPRFSIDRARLFTESFRKTEGQHQTLRWSKALKQVVENLPLFIAEDDLIVGRGCGYEGRWGLIYPELESGVLENLARTCLSGEANRYSLTSDDAMELLHDILPYWKGKNYYEAVVTALPEDTRKLVFLDEALFQWRGVLVPSQPTRHAAQWVLDYEKVLKKGFKGLKQEAQARIANLDPLDWRNQTEKNPFLEAVVLTCEAAVTLAKRYADLARLQAESAKTKKRREELLNIAEICDRVPENPAGTFREAVQAQWFVQLFSRLEQKTGGVVSNGRMDQYLYPFYRRDVDEKRMTSEEAQEILEHLWLCMANYVEMYSGASGAAFTEGYAHWETVTIGGKTKDGRDASNELSHLLLKSKREFPLNYPDLGARIHSQTPDAFLFDICETIKDGTGTPKLANDEEIIPYYLGIGVDLQEANDYALSGCTESRLMNRETYLRGVTWLNLGAIVEMTLNDGKLKMFGEEQLGVPTGDPATFGSYQDLFRAFRLQFEHLLKHLFIAHHLSDVMGPRYLAAPLASMLNDTCLEACLDIQTGHVPKGVHRAEFDYTGYATAVDSLAAVKHLVFDKKEISMPELLEALDLNFEGRETLRQRCLNAPKYGNNDPETNAIGLAVERVGVEFCHRYPLFNGGRMHVRYIPVTSHVAMGFMVGATPNGRKSNTFLSEGSSPTQGSNKEGISAVLLSNAASKNNTYSERAARLLNMKLVPATVAGKEGTRKLMALVRSWLDLKLWHMQFNIVNKSTLLAAQREPEQYRDLIVRVAGYNAYFTDLTPDLQNEIIARAEYEF